jgi:lipid A ethanolaminephosphotransferase
MINKIKQLFAKKPISANQLIILVSLYFIAVFNQPFLTLAFTKLLALEEHSNMFMFTVPFLLLSLLLIIFSLFSVKYLLKPALIILTLISALVFYATSAYGVVFDYSMMVNVVETDNAEASAYLNIHAILFFLFSGILPALLIALAKVEYQPFAKEVLQRVKLVAAALGLFLIIAYFFYSNYAAFGRNNHSLKKYIVPIQVMDSSYKVIRDLYFTAPIEFKVLDPAPSFTDKTTKQNVLILVVGETARAMNFSYNGYQRNTNAYTPKYQPLYFQNVTSCGTATSTSLPCIFSSLKREQFDKKTADNQQNLLDIVNLAGGDVVWIDNQSGCKGVCKRVTTIDIPTTKTKPLCDGDYCFDEALLAPLTTKLNNLSKQTTLIVLHTIGSHGPTYYRRYSRDFAKFLPDCQRSDIQNCSSEQLINTYDNTIAYTDFVLAKIIKQLKQLPENVNSSMLYISDHGESLGESGAYLHGFPYAFAPKEQIEIPMLFWQSANNNEINHECLADIAKNKTLSHDNVFSSLLGLLQVQSSAHKIADDIFTGCRN